MRCEKKVDGKQYFKYIVLYLGDNIKKRLTE